MAKDGEFKPEEMERDIPSLVPLPEPKAVGSV